MQLQVGIAGLFSGLNMVHDGNEIFAPSLTLIDAGTKPFFQALNQTGIDWFLCWSVSF